jgi:hypothetical protein
MIQQEEPPIDIVPPKKIAFIAYYIGVYESVQKFGSLITSGKLLIMNLMCKRYHNCFSKPYESKSY